MVSRETMDNRTAGGQAYTWMVEVTLFSLFTVLAVTSALQGSEC